jgi:hypothetical protein
MKSNLTAIFTIKNHLGNEWKIAQLIPGEAGFFGDRYVDDTVLNASLYSSFNEDFSALIIGKLVQQKRLRRDLLREICTKLGDALADHLESKEEWDVFESEIGELSKTKEPEAKPEETP